VLAIKFIPVDATLEFQGTLYLVLVLTPDLIHVDLLLTILCISFLFWKLPEAKTLFFSYSMSFSFFISLGLLFG